MVYLVMGQIVWDTPLILELSDPCLPLCNQFLKCQEFGHACYSNPITEGTFCLDWSGPFGLPTSGQWSMMWAKASDLYLVVVVVVFVAVFVVLVLRVKALAEQILNCTVAPYLSHVYWHSALLAQFCIE